MWDFKGRNISHPRDYFILGYDPGTGDPTMPWLTDKLYKEWEKSDMNIPSFLNSLPTYKNQSLAKKPSKDLIQKGLIALDCRYLNFAPQCDGWNNITQYGGSGSFVIHWSGLKKLTTAASIPDDTGMIKGISRFQKGEMKYRLDNQSSNETILPTCPMDPVIWARSSRFFSIF
ncbi:MAG: hypothetical protein GY860_03440 [Desulfobacteraceae bacterium]|nr:hypothetical protein [Desulfobacteraceae bacterium]